MYLTFNSITSQTTNSVWFKSIFNIQSLKKIYFPCVLSQDGTGVTTCYQNKHVIRECMGSRKQGFRCRTKRQENLSPICTGQKQAPEGCPLGKKNPCRTDNIRFCGKLYWEAFELKGEGRWKLKSNWAIEKKINLKKNNCTKTTQYTTWLRSKQW